MPYQPKESQEPGISTWWSAEWRGILAEFLSTLMLVLLGCMSCLPIPGIDTTIYVPFAFGVVVMFNVQIFGHISGAFMNPAVTLASVIWGSTPIGVGVIYTVVECVGAILGYGILYAFSPLDLVADGVCVTRPYPSLDAVGCLIVEISVTFALCMICLSVWDPIHVNKQDSTAIKIGLTIFGLCLIGGPLTGASMNPARSLGPAVWTNHWTKHWVYWVGPFAGSGLATVVYKYIFFMTR